MLFRSLVLPVLVCTLAYAGGPQRIRWSFGPAMPMAKTCRATAAVGDEIVTVGGTWWETAGSGTKMKRWASAAYKFDTRGMEWKTLPEYPLPIAYAFAAVVGRRLYVIGGRGGKRSYTETFVLNIDAHEGKWVAGPPLPKPRWGHVGGIVNGRICVAGGHEGDSTEETAAGPSDAVLALDPQHPERGWQRIASLPRPEAEWRMATGCGGRLYFFGGLIPAAHTADKGFLPQAEAFALDLASRRWQVLRRLPVAMGSGSAVSVGATYIVLAGGYALALPASSTPDHKARTYFTGECLLYDTVRDTYRTLAPVKLAVVDAGLVYVRRKLFAIGGEDAPYQSRTDALQIGNFE